jgi:hypothetical protein
VLHLDPRLVFPVRPGFVAAIAVLGSWISAPLAAEAVELHPGDIVFAVFDGYGGACLDGCGAVLKVDPVTGEHTPISVGGYFRDPTGVALDPTTGHLIVIDRARPLELVRVVPESGEQFALPRLPEGACTTNACGMDVDRQGIIYLGGQSGNLNAWRLSTGARVPGVTGSVFTLEREGTAVGWFGATLLRNAVWRPYEEELVTDQGYLERPQAMAVDPDGMLIVADSFRALVEVHPRTGEQRVLTSSLLPMLAEGIAAEANGDILFTTGNPTSLYRFHRDTGAMTFLSAITTQQNLVAKRPGNFFVYPETACNDGFDDDGDGLIDAEEDPGCENRMSLREDPPCQDGRDNDGDGLVDFDGGASANGGVPIAEPDTVHCIAASGKYESRACGLGGELPVLLGLARLVVLRERNRRLRRC